MAETIETKRITIYRFGRFEICANERTLRQDGQPVQLSPKIFDTLLFLVENNGKLVSKDEIMQMVWADSFVEETNLTSNVSRLRKILHEDGCQYIETLPKRGYRFQADVELDNGETPNEILLTRRVTARIQTTVEEDSPEIVAGTISAQTARLSPFHQNSRRNYLLAAFGALLLLVGGFFAYFFLSPPKPPENINEVKSLAILPFRELNVKDEKYLGIGLTDTLITKFAGLRQVIVRPTSAVRKYTEIEKSAIEIGKELGVETVMEGNVQRDGDRVRVSVQLLRVSDGAPFWSETFEDRQNDIFALQDAIALKVRDTMALQLSSDDNRMLEKRGTRNAEAYEAFLKGRFFYGKSTIPDIRQSIVWYEKAIALDPNYAMPRVGLANSYSMLSNLNSLSPEEALPKGRAELRKALELDDKLASAHSTLALYKWMYEWDWDGVEREYRRALELNPNDAIIHGYFGSFLALRKRETEALHEIKRAAQIDPLSQSVAYMSGTALGSLGKTEEAFSMFGQLLEMEPNSPNIRLELAKLYLKTGRFDEAIAEFDRAKAGYKVKAEDDDDWVAMIGYAHGRAGHRAEAVAARDEILRRLQKRKISPFAVATAQAGAGDTEQTFLWLEKAYAERASDLRSLGSEVWMTELSADPRFQDLVHRIGLLRNN